MLQFMLVKITKASNLIATADHTALCIWWQIEWNILNLICPSCITTILMTVEYCFTPLPLDVWNVG